MGEEFSLETVHYSHTLASLPTDIVRIIIRNVATPFFVISDLKKIRTISPKWNRIVVDCLSDRRNYRPIDTMEISDGEHITDVEISMHIDKVFHNIFLSACRGWKIDGTKFERASVNVTLWNPFGFAFIALTAPQIIYVCGLMAIERTDLRAFGIGVIIIVIGFIACVLSFLKYCVMDDRRELSSIFRRCSYVSTYRAYFLGCGKLNAVGKAMENVPIKHLIVYSSIFSTEDSLRKTIIKMVRAHNVQFVSMHVDSCKIKGLRKFFAEITKVAERLDIYSTSEKSEKFFGKPRDFWEKKVRDMNDDSFSVQIMNGESGDYSFRFRIFATNNLAH